MAHPRALQLLCCALVAHFVASETTLSGIVDISTSLAARLDAPLDLSTVLIEVTPEQGPRLRAKCAADGSFSMAVPDGMISARSLSRGNLVFSRGGAQVLRCAHGACNDGHPLNFTVTGMIVTGRVVDPSGHPVAGVDIRSDDIILGTTNSQGKYKLSNIKPGRFSLQAVKPHTVISPIVGHLVRVGDEKLPDMVVQLVSICGKLVYGNATFDTFRRVTVSSDDGSYLDAAEINMGRYCIQVKPGRYQITPTSAQEERAQGLIFLPSSYNLQVRGEGRGDVDFVQEQTSLIGSVKCFRKCPDRLRITVEDIRTNRTLHHAHLSDVRSGFSQNASVFSFKGMGPGLYRVKVHKRGFCWEQPAVDAVVRETHGYAPVLVQRGVMLNVTSDADASLAFMNVKDYSIYELNITRGSSATCFEAQGKFRVNSGGFFNFGEAAGMIEWDSERHQSFNLVAVNPRLHIWVHMPPLQRDPEARKPRAQAPAAAGQEGGKGQCDASCNGGGLPMVEVFYHSTGERKTSLLAPRWAPDLHEAMFDIEFNETVTIRPISRSYIFQPASLNYTDTGHRTAPKELPRFHGHPATRKQGVVTPKLKGVEVTAISTKQPELRVSTTTDEEGGFSLYPMYEGQAYELVATAAGWEFELVSSSPRFWFRGTELSRVKLQVTADDGEAVAAATAVLSSTSGSSRRKQASLGQDLHHTFQGVAPGDYSLSLSLDGYSFEPESLALKVAHGKHMYSHTFSATPLARPAADEAASDAQQQQQQQQVTVEQVDAAGAAAGAAGGMCTAASEPSGSAAGAGDPGVCSAPLSTGDDTADAAETATAACSASNGQCSARAADQQQPMSGTGLPPIAPASAPDALHPAQQAGLDVVAGQADDGQQQVGQQHQHHHHHEQQQQQEQGRRKDDASVEAEGIKAAAELPAAISSQPGPTDAAEPGAESTAADAASAGEAQQTWLDAAAATLGLPITAGRPADAVLLGLLGLALLLLAARRDVLLDILHVGKVGKRVSGAGASEGGAASTSSSEGRRSATGSSASRSSSIGGAAPAAKPGQGQQQHKAGAKKGGRRIKA